MNGFPELLLLVLPKRILVWERKDYERACTCSRKYVNGGRLRSLDNTQDANVVPEPCPSACLSVPAPSFPMSPRENSPYSRTMRRSPCQKFHIQEMAKRPMKYCFVSICHLQGSSSPEGRLRSRRRSRRRSSRRSCTSVVLW